MWLLLSMRRELCAPICLQGAVAEGVLTSRSAHHLAQRQGIDCPTIEGIFHVH